MPAAIDRKLLARERTHSQNYTDCGYPSPESRIPSPHLL